MIFLHPGSGFQGLCRRMSRIRQQNLVLRPKIGQLKKTTTEIAVCNGFESSELRRKYVLHSNTKTTLLCMYVCSSCLTTTKN